MFDGPRWSVTYGVLACWRVFVLVPNLIRVDIFIKHVVYENGTPAIYSVHHAMAKEISAVSQNWVSKEIN